MKNNRDIQGRVEALIRELGDPQKMQQYGFYAMRNGKPIAPKIQDIIYPRMVKNINPKIIEAIISKVKERATEVSYKNNLKSGLIFLVPYSTAIPLAPGDYLSQRINFKDDKVLFIDQINIILDLSTDRENPQYYGACLFICGVLSPKKLSEISITNNSIISEYETTINYFNDFITACKLLLHDHNLCKLTRKSLPSQVKYFDLDSGREKPLSTLKEFNAGHVNDLMDIREKFLLQREFLENLFPAFCEQLPFNYDIRYCLDLALDAMNAFCLEDYKKCLINSDLFAEFSMKIIWKNIPTLSERQMPDQLYAKSGKPSISGMIASELGVRGDAIIGEWANKSRAMRNDFVHKMKYDAFSEKSMQKAMKYNFKIIQLFIEKMNLPRENPLSLLSVISNLYEHVYEK